MHFGDALRTNYFGGRFRHVGYSRPVLRACDAEVKLVGLRDDGGGGDHKANGPPIRLAQNRLPRADGPTPGHTLLPAEGAP